MNGLFFIDKDSGCTSRDVVNEIIKKVETNKVGHTGTLDPIASGVLVICVGKATKLVSKLMAEEKEYEVSVTLGIKTDTLDITGQVLKEEEVYVSKKQIEDVLDSFIGTYEQEVPIYSAVKVAGKRLYEYAREGKQVVLPKRMVNIKQIKLISEPQMVDNHLVFKIRTTVSKGTYIRSLVSDIAKRLNTIGTMSSLRRIRLGNIRIDKCQKIDDLRLQDLVPVSEVLGDYPNIVVDEVLKKDILNGKIVENKYNSPEVVFVDKNNHVLALYKTYDKDNTKIKPDVMLGGI